MIQRAFQIFAIFAAVLLLNERTEAGCKLNRTIATVAVLAEAEAKATADAPAADSSAKSTRAFDEEAIRKSAREFARAFEAGDAKAAAAQWTLEGEYRSDSGEVIRGRANLEKAYATLFQKSPKSRLDVQIQSIRFPSRDMAVEEGVIVVSPRGSELPTSTRYHATHAREDGQWKTALVREWREGRFNLGELSWLVGDWKATTTQGELRLNFAWNPKKTFLIQRFSVIEGGKEKSSGTQFLGVDPASGVLRGWTFDDDGGEGQSRWLPEESRWIATAVGTSPDGRNTSAVNILSRTSDDEFSWRSVDRKLDGTPLPDSTPIKLVRITSAQTK